jgi:hypothetical protein
MLSLEEFAQLAAIISAMADVYTVGRDTFSAFLSRRESSPEYIAKGRRLQQALSTFSDGELDAIKQRIEACRARFIREGSGAQRRECLCSVLSDVMVGNGGIMPDPEWTRVYEQLAC